MTKNGISVDKKGNVHVDEAFLAEYVKNGGEVKTQNGTPIDEDSLLNEVGKDHKDTTKKADELHKEVEQVTKEDDKQNKENEKLEKKKQEEIRKAEEQAKRIKKQQISTAQHIASTAKKVSDPIVKQSSELVNHLSKASTVGGIGLLLFILIFLLFIVVEVNANGDTRIKQLWYMLVGRASLKDKVQITKNYSANNKPDLTTQDSRSVESQISSGQFQGPLGSLISNTFRPSSNDVGF
jgi:flagellar biosynthesis GTPase FlhF